MSNEPLKGRKFFEFSDEQRLNWLRLYRSQNVGPIIFRDLISHFGTAAAALEALPDLAKRGGAASGIRICPVDKAERELLAANRLGARFVALGEPGYPPDLRSYEQAPPILCVKGNLEQFAKPAIAIVGSRNASVTGMKMTERLSGKLSDAGYAIVSGLARGIDTAAHKASLSGGTIAVFGGGIDRIFPEENIPLAEEIIENKGLLVSEMPVGWQARARDFPRRNRIVSGLSKAVLVVEAAKRSGSLITARLANEMGRIVLAVPGSPLDPRSEGTNGLIREGATLIRSADDVLEAVTPVHGNQESFLFDIRETEDAPLSDASRPLVPQSEVSGTLRERIIAALGPAPAEIDDLVRYCESNPGAVQLVLLELALAGKIERHSGNRVSLVMD